MASYVIVSHAAPLEDLEAKKTIDPLVPDPQPEVSTTTPVLWFNFQNHTSQDGIIWIQFLFDFPVLMVFYFPSKWAYEHHIPAQASTSPSAESMDTLEAWMDTGGSRLMGNDLVIVIDERCDYIFAGASILAQPIGPGHRISTSGCWTSSGECFEGCCKVLTFYTFPGGNDSCSFGSWNSSWNFCSDSKRKCTCA